MDTLIEKKNIKKGGSFLIEKHGPEAIFTPEDLTEDDYVMAETAEEFWDGEVVPKIKEIQEGNNELVVQLIKKAGELGMLSAEIPEEFGGMAINKKTSTLLTERSCKDAGLAVSMGAHTGIGTMPITYFGNQEQKERYLPRLATGEIIAAYALTETSSGSDALSARTRATLSEDGRHYILNGSKMWITNGGFADIFVVFAKIDGQKFSAFIVERDMEGFSTGAEEKKMGIKSSSTRLINLENVHVPVENLLGQPGEGHKIAFNILNIGRVKLGPASIGGSKLALGESTKYAIDRMAFGKSISEFGLIKHKLAEMAVQIFAQESMTYRTMGYIDDILEGIDPSDEDAEARTLEGIREYAIECCLVKIFATESLSYVADEAVQIHGGYGYSREYNVERYYRDARINRIFEGTNEINRMLSVDMLLKKGMKGELPLLARVQGVMGQAMMGMLQKAPVGEGFLAAEVGMAEDAKKLALLVSGAAVQKFMQGLEEQQELLAMGADLLIRAFVMESMVLRARKHAERESEAAAALMGAMTRVFCNDAMDQLATIGKNALCAIQDGAALEPLLKTLKTLTDHPTVNTVALRRQIADKVIEAHGYPLDK